MPPLNSNIRLARMPSGIGPAFRGWVLDSLRRIARHASASIQIEGASSSSVGIDGERYFKVASGGTAAACVYAWTPTFVRNEDGNDVVTLEVGALTDIEGEVTVNIDVETVLTDILSNPAPELLIPDDDLYIAYLEIEVTKTKTANDFVTGCTIDAAEIKVATSLPTSDQSTRYLELFRWYGGALFSQLTKYNLYLVARDDGTSNDVGVFTFLYAQ